jgi:nicotinamidase-related amidase
MHSWDKFIPENDIKIHELSGHGKQQGFGKRPVVLVIDVTYDFIGDEPKATSESIEKFPNSCGQAGWKAVGEIKKLLSAARSHKIPVMYTKGESRQDGFDLGGWRNKLNRAQEATSIEGDFGCQVAEPIRPHEKDLILSKKKPSAFFGTPLASYLIDLKVDTVIVVGCTTSGCVRATVVDGFSYGFRMVVPEQGVFDRFEISHAVNLFDMNAKYADVVSVNDAVQYLNSCTDDIFNDSGLEF